MSCNSSERSESGFSLVEALVAVAVFSMACLGVFVVQTMSARSLAAAEERTLAGLVAQNTLVEAAASADPLRSAQESQVRLADRTWRVEATVEPVPASSMLQVRVVVRAEGRNAPAADLTAYVAPSSTS